jgi:hypothetical protein
MTEAKPAVPETPSKADVETLPTGDAPEAEASTSKVRKRRIDVDSSLILSEGRSKRRKTPTPEPETKVKLEVKNEVVDRKKVKDLGRVIYEKIMAKKDTEWVSTFYLRAAGLIGR